MRKSRPFGRKYILPAIVAFAIYTLTYIYLGPGAPALPDLAFDAGVFLLWYAGMCISFRASVALRRRVVGPGADTSLPSPNGVTSVLGIGMVAYLLSIAGYIRLFAILNWPMRMSGPEGPRFGMEAGFIMLSWLAVPLFVFCKPSRWLPKLLAAALLASQLRSVRTLLKHTAYTTPYSDDHPSFLFRLSEFFGAFPWRENYVPQWNAGIVNSVITSSGTSGYALLGAPLFLFMEPHEAMPYVLLFIFAFFVPWMTVWGLRSAGMSGAACLTGGILAFCANRFFFKWLLHFGTVGAMLSCAMLPAAVAFLYAATMQPRVRKNAYAGLVISLFFMVQWPPMMMFGLPMGVIALLGSRRWWRSRRRWPFIGAAAALGILILPILIGTFAGHSVMGFAISSHPDAQTGWGAIWKNAIGVFGELLMDNNPIVVFLGFGGAFFMGAKRLRRSVVLVLLFALAVAVVGPSVLPNMQLSRIAFEASAISIVAAAYLSGRAFAVNPAGMPVVQAALLSMLLCSLVNVPKFYGARDEVRYYGMRPFVTEFAEWIRNTVPESGRLLFAGPAVHFYGRGHIAYLPEMTGREMMSCDYYGFPRGMVEYDYPPRAWRTKPGGLHRFMTLHGVTHAIAREKRYIDLFRSEPRSYREVATLRDGLEPESEVAVAFEVIGTETLMSGGDGNVKSGFNIIDVSFNDVPEGEVVLKYNWNDRMHVDPPARIFPYDTGEGPIFVGVEPAGEKHIKIKYRSRF